MILQGNIFLYFYQEIGIFKIFTYLPRNRNLIPSQNRNSGQLYKKI